MPCIRLLKHQKSTGSLHAHSQVFVQCLHRHTWLSDIRKNQLRQQPWDIIKEYLKYKAHVVCQVYETPPEVLQTKLQ